jgi:tryptophan synthase alpha chain
VSERLKVLFAGDRRRARFLPYVCVGYPTFALSLATAHAALDAGADALELGVPFSDPVADGPTLQKATHLSLSRGTQVEDVFRLMRALRSAGRRQPLLAMTYLNPVEQMGWSRFCSRLRGAGGDGAIIPDLPTESMRGFSGLLRRHDLALIPFLAPTSERGRERSVEALRAPFLYYVSVTGVTGARQGLDGRLLPALRGLKRRLRTPVVVGFGISTPQQAAHIGRAAAGVIIASALVDLVSRTPARRVSDTVRRFCRRVVVALGRGKER